MIGKTIARNGVRCRTLDGDGGMGKHGLPLHTTTSKLQLEPWLTWLSGLSASLQTKRSLVRFPFGSHAWVAGQVPSGECMSGNHTLMFLSFSSSLPTPLSKNKEIKSLLKSGQFARKDEQCKQRDWNSTKEWKVNARNQRHYNRNEECLWQAHQLN